MTDALIAQASRAIFWETAEKLFWHAKGGGAFSSAMERA